MARTAATSNVVALGPTNRANRANRTNDRPSYKRRKGDITEADIRQLKDLIEYEGLKEISRAIGISEVALLRVCAGWFDRCNRSVRQAVLHFFGQVEG